MLMRKRVPTMLSSGNSLSMRQSMCQWAAAPVALGFLLIDDGRGRSELADEAQRLEPRAIGRGGVGRELEADGGHPRLDVGREKLEIDRGAERFLEPRQFGGEVRAEERADRLASLHLEIIDRGL